MTETLKASRDHWKLLARSILPVEVSKLAIEQDPYKDLDMNSELEQPITDVINKILKPKLGIDNVVEVIGLDAAVKLAHALRDVPVQTTEKVVYVPRTEPWPTSPRPWWDPYHNPPVWTGDRTAPLIGTDPNHTHFTFSGGAASQEGGYGDTLVCKG